MSNIDLVPANILILKDRQVVIDYEWTFDFPVPADFILYRMIHYYSGKRRKAPCSEGQGFLWQSRYYSGGA